MAHCSNIPTILNPSVSLLLKNVIKPNFFFHQFNCGVLELFRKSNNSEKISINGRLHHRTFILRCTSFSTPTLVSETESEYATEEEYDAVEEHKEETRVVGNGQMPPPVQRRRRSYRKECPGEKKGISEEMRFVAMKLRNNGGKKSKISSTGGGGGSERDEAEPDNDGEKEDISSAVDTENDEDKRNGEMWQPSMEGFLNYLVDSELIFRTVERIVDESSDVSYVYFRKTGLERSDCLSRDLEWFRQQGHVIPQPNTPGVTYVRYLEELAETSPPSFLCHFYNIYFSHIAGGQVIAKQASEKLLEGRELEFSRWEGDAEDLLRGVRQNLNALGEHWSRDEKNKCLSETTKAYRFMGQIVRLIILIP